jgi:hypothetical protein
MNNQSVARAAMVAAIVALIIGGAVGYGVGHAKASSKSDSMSTMSSMTAASGSKASDLRANLVALGTQHMDLTAQAVDAALDGSPNADAAKADLIKNGTEISAAIGSVYGADAQAKFQDIWNLHLNDFVKYAVASKGGDAAGKAAALQDINTGYTMPISKLLSGANPNLPEKALVDGFNEHIDMTAQMIDDHVKGDYTGEASLREQSVEHLKGLMTTLSGAIVKQYPAKFQG